MVINSDRIGPVFNNKHVLITGASGFMGKVFFERLLRCTEVEKIYILLRAKKGVKPKERVLKIFENSLFNRLKSSKNLEKLIETKIVVISGDCSVLNLGLSEKDTKLIHENVSLIYHFAATTRFDESLKSAMDLNVRGTYELLKIARECKNLQLFCHISTAYCHLEEKFLLEKCYSPPFDPHEMMKFVNEPHDAAIVTRFLSPTIPNTYVLTKALAETLVDEARSNFQLPVMIVRPSIVIPTLNEPEAGWVNDYNSLGGLLIAIGKGVLRTIYCNEKFHADFVPVDIAINALMACTWNYLSMCDKKNFVINFTSSQEIALRWGEALKKGMKACVEKYPMSPMLWYPNVSLVKYRWLHKLKSIYLHWIPAVIVDTLLFCLGTKPVLMKVQRKINNGLETIETFANNQWNFDYKNFVQIRKQLNSLEAQTYKISSEGIDVDEYIENFVLGGHKHLMNRKSMDFSKEKKIVKIMSFVDKFMKMLLLSFLIYFLISRLLH